MDPRILNFVMDSLENSKDFILEQAPQVVQQFVIYNSIYFGTIASLSIIGILVSSIWLYRNINNLLSVKLIPKLALHTFILVSSIMFLHRDGLAAVKVIFAPKVFLIEEAYKLTQKESTNTKILETKQLTDVEMIEKLSSRYTITSLKEPNNESTTWMFIILYLLGGFITIVVGVELYFKKEEDLSILIPIFIFWPLIVISEGLTKLCNKYKENKETKEENK